MLASRSLALGWALLASFGARALPQASPTPTPSNANASPQSSPSSSSSGKACNNSPILCDRKYNNITYMGAHDSAFLRDSSTDNSLSGNQYLNATSALDAGLRLLQAQVHDANGTLALCHTSCDLLDAGSLQSWLSKIADWMSRNPNEVVTMLLVNSDSKSAAQFGQAFHGSGLDKYAYSPATSGATSDWPTLQSMIDKNTRLVSFITNIDATSSYSYLLPEFDYVFETSYEVFSLSGFNCTLNRPSSQSSASAAIDAKFMGLLNHFKEQSIASGTYIPDVSNIGIVNSNGTTQDGELGKHIQQCASSWGVTPSFVLVDFWNDGQTIQAADAENGVKHATGRSFSNTTSSSDSNGDSAASNNVRDSQTMALVVLLAGLTLLM